MQLKPVRAALALALLGFAASCASVTPASAPASPAGSPGRCDGSPESNRQVVLAFYRLALVDMQPRAAFERYASPTFVEHKPDVEHGTREAAAGFLERLIAALPQRRWEILRTIAEGDLVFLHARFTPAPGAAPWAVADVFRLRDCRIVEHWDVVAPPPEAQRNPNPRF